MRRRRREGRGRRREEKKGWETEKGGKRGLWATASWGSHGQVHLPHRAGTGPGPGHPGPVLVSGKENRGREGGENPVLEEGGKKAGKLLRRWSLSSWPESRWQQHPSSPGPEGSS